MTIEDLRNMFPSKGDNNALCGVIPINYFNEHEEEIRNAMLEWEVPLRIRYRGPRISNRLTYKWMAPGNTRRCDATGAMIYYA
jgi:hypothetical protein